MTWSKFDDAAPKSPKARNAGNDAWALWAAAVMYCNRHLTDGFVSLAALSTDCLPVPISLARAKKLAQILCETAVGRPNGIGLFEKKSDDMYLVHDFLEWNPSKEEVEIKRKKDRFRKGFRADSERIPGESDEGLQGGRRADSETPRASPVPPVPSRPGREEDPPPPPDVKSGAGKRCLDALTVGSPARRPDVQRVYEAWKLAFQHPATLSLRDSWAGGDALHISTAVDHHGEDQCLLVAKHAPDDGMVSGRSDENKVPHQSVGYIFGNEAAFTRILSDALKQESRRKAPSALSLIEQLKAAPSGSSSRHVGSGDASAAQTGSERPSETRIATGHPGAKTGQA